MWPWCAYLGLCAAMASKSVVVGIDLGTAESYVAYVGKGTVDVVQNEVSKRATATIVSFTDRERLTGDAALAQVRSNAKNSCRNFKHLLGRKLDATDLQAEHFWSTSKLCECADGKAGYDVVYKGEPRQISAVEVTAMYLTKLKEITEKCCEGKVTAAVIAVPSSFADAQRHAVLDAAKVANIPVLRLINEHTATALAYGIYRSNEFDPERPMTVAFCSMGQSLFSVSIVQFLRCKLTVLCEQSDKVGGRELDECLMREFAAQFKERFGCDPLANKKAAFKLEDAVAKTKKILSANTEASVTCECLMEEHDFSSQITRADLERMCEPAMRRVRAVLEGARAASGLTKEQIDSVEVVGGGSRVPWVKKLCAEAFGKEVATTMNQEESVARGAALQAAILSPLYKVRDFAVEDTTPFAINLGWMGTGAPGSAEEDGETHVADVEGEYRTSTVFPRGSPINTLKVLTFYTKGSFEIKAEYADEKSLLLGTPKQLGSYKIHLLPQAQAKKVEVCAKITLHGTFCLEGAQLVEEEEYEEVVKERRELPKENVEVASARNGEVTAANGENGAEEKAGKGEGEQEHKQEPERAYEWVDVKKPKRRLKKTDLKVTATGTPGLSDEVIQKLMDAETAMQAEMREIIETDEKRNDLESYIFDMREKICEGSEYGDFISSADRRRFSVELAEAEEWLLDNPEATKAEYAEKLEELKRTGDAVVWKFKEASMRAEWIQALTGTIKNYRTCGENPPEQYSHVVAQRLAKIVAACKDLEAWLQDLRAKQDVLPKHETPVLTCADMEAKSQELSRMADEILREARPAPRREESKEEAQRDEMEEKGKEDTREESARGAQRVDVE